MCVSRPLSLAYRSDLAESDQAYACRVGGAGSFLRPNAKGLERPRSFGDALISKYGPPSLVPSPSTATESRSTLTEPQAEQETKSYSAAFHSKIEVILNSKRNQRGLDGLKEIGLEGACVDRCADSPEERECIKKLTSEFDLTLSIFVRLPHDRTSPQFRNQLIIMMNRSTHLEFKPMSHIQLG